MKKQFILIQGPTGVGKSDTITAIGNTIPIEVVNCDVGQFYEPFAIGTAKPNWKNEPIPHHLFDIIKEPKNFTVSTYRNLIISTMDAIWKRGNTPVLVGGSGFYGKSLFFPPCSMPTEWNDTSIGTWDDLAKLDPERAKTIDKNDTYRIGRALSLLKNTHYKPSECFPKFKHLAEKCLVIFLNRERQELYQRINSRTLQMFEEGWLEETKNLIGTPWENFLERKKLIGYTDILDYLKTGDYSSIAKNKLIAKIAQKTRHYAKRQGTFWRMFKKILEPHFKNTQSQIIEINLTDDGKEVKKHLKKFLSE